MPSIDELIAAADAAAGGGSKPRMGSGEYIAKQGAAGVADTIGSIGDLPARLYQLGKVGIGMQAAPVLSAITGRPKSDFMPEVNIPATTIFSDYLKNLAGVDESAKAPDSMSRYAGAVARGAGGSVLTGGGGTLRDVLVNSLKSGGVGGVAGFGAEAGGDTAEALGVPRMVGQVLGGLGGGVGAASAGGMVGAATRVPKMMDQMQAMARDPASIAKAERTASSIVDARMRAAVEGTPNAAQNIDEALALRARIPGFSPSVAEMSQSPAAMEMQRTYARGSPKALNEEVARVAASEQALRDYYNRIAPSAGQQSNVRSALNQRLAGERGALQAEAQQTAGQLPSADLVGIGGRAAELAAAEKAAARPGIASAYQKAYDLAPDSAIDAKPILAKIEETLGVPLAQIKPDTAPNTFSAIKRFLGGNDQKTPEELAYLSSALGGNVENVGSKATMTLREAHDLRKAINADASLAARSQDPLAATRLRNVAGVRETIDDTIAGSPIAQEAKDALMAADAKYKTEFAPRFNEGANRLMFKEGVNNEPRIIADKFVDAYFKKDQQGGGTRAENFKQLFGKNNEARELTKEGVLDRFRAAVVNPETGVIDAGKAAAFKRDYGRTLEAFKANGVNALDDIKTFTQTAARQEQAMSRLSALSRTLKFDYTDDLVNAALGDKKIMDNVKMRLTPDTRETFTRLVMDKAMESGTGEGVLKFLDTNKATVGKLLTPEHQSSLRDIAKGMTMIEQSPVKGLAGSGTTDPLKASTGVSMATVWSQWRAVSGGRQGVATMGFNLAAPVFTRLSQTKFDDVMKTALHDPKTAENLSNLLKSQSPVQATNFAMKLMNSLKTAGSIAWQSKGPIGEMALGLSNYPANLKRTIPAINTELQGNEQ